MNYVPLGRTGVMVSPLCLGCMMFGGRTDQEETCATIDKALDAGINFLDTANVYSRGRSEEVAGEALKRNGKRGRVVLATKVHGRMSDDDPNGLGNTRRHIIEQCEASLRRLKTDYIDLYQIHRPQPSVPIDETLRALDDLVRAGKVRYLGASTFASWHLVESLWVSRELGLNRFVTEQPPYNLLDRRIERELLPMARTYGFGVIPWSPLAGGLLTGKYRRGQPPAEDTRFAYVNKAPGGTDARYNDLVFDVLEKLEPLAREKNCSLSQFSLAWVLQQPGITSPIIGPRNVAQLEDNLGALQVTVTEEDRKRIDEIVPPGRMTVPYYEFDYSPLSHRLA